MRTPRFPFLGAFSAFAHTVVAAGLCLAFVSGCSSIPKLGRSSSTPAAFVPSNHEGDAKLPAGLRRVVLLPLAGSDVASPESVCALDPVIVSALQRQNRFEVVPLTRDECRRYFQTDEISSVSEIPANLMSVLQREYAADAVLFIDLTVYRAYHPLAIGLRAKLATIGSAHLVWTFDNVFSADDPSVANSAVAYLKPRDQNGLPSDMITVDLESPVRFATYASAAMFATLPPVNAPGTPVKAKRDTANERSSTREPGRSSQ
jgi:hypothetical protein